LISPDRWRIIDPRRQEGRAPQDFYALCFRVGSMAPQKGLEKFRRASFGLLQVGVY
jgi:hypothetical protein